MSGEADHVHLSVTYPPNGSISSLVPSLKGVSSRMLRQDRPDIAHTSGGRCYGGRHILPNSVAVRRCRSSSSMLMTSNGLTIMEVAATPEDERDFVAEGSRSRS